MATIPATASLADRIELLPITAPDPDIEKQLRTSRRLDALLALIVVAFAFLTASFAARNSDYWLHLATGRALASGNYHFGTDPFNHTTEGIRWVNHSWSFDWALYQLQRAVGDTGIMILKACGIALLAVLMLGIRRRDQGLWLPALFTALALLVMSPRLLLQPVLVSLVFLALTLFVVSRSEPNSNRLWWLPPLFALWVNLDAWFLLGPITVLLFLVGQFVGGRPVRTAALVLLAGVAACLANPHHVHAFRLPLELSPAVLTSDFAEDARLRRLFETPWRLGRYQHADQGLNAAGLAYFMLLGLGLGSFLLRKETSRDWRFPVWLVFAALGAWSLRTVPFFAVVGGPIAALNVQDTLARRTWPAASRLELAIRRGNFGRVLSIIMGVVFLAVAWPGWLQALPYDARRVTWEVQADPSLTLASKALQQCFDRGQLTAEDLIFASHPDFGPYLAWHCPQAKGYIDTRLELFTSLSGEYESVCRSLNPTLGTRSANDDREALNALQSRGVTVLVLFDHDLHRSMAALGGRAMDEPKRFPLLFIAGKALMFGHNGGELENGQRLATWKFDADRLAYSADTGDMVVAPKFIGRTGTYPVEPGISQKYLMPSRPRPWQSDAAAMYLRYYDEFARRQQAQRGREAQSAFITALIGSSFGPEHVTPCAELASRLSLASAFLPEFESAPAAVNLLAIRSARAALAIYPNDAHSWLRLGQAYLNLRIHSKETSWDRRSRAMDILRHAQIAMALENALRLDPDLEIAHATLGALYEGQGMIDAALLHRRDEVRLARQAGLRSGESEEQFRKRLTSMEARLQAMELAVQHRRNEFALQAQQLTGAPYRKAVLAERMGLGRQALDDILLQANVVETGIDGARLQLDLLLRLGRTDPVRMSLDDADMAGNPQSLRLIAFPPPALSGYSTPFELPALAWFNLLLGAAAGDADRLESASSALDAVLSGRAPPEQHEIAVRTLAVSTATDVGLAAAPEMRLVVNLGNRQRDSLSRFLNSFDESQRHRADFLAMSGLLLLELGDVPGAARRLQMAAMASAGPDLGGAPPASQHVVQFYQELLDRAGRHAPR
jgi:hypothetical protein